MERLRYPFDLQKWEQVPKEIYESARRIHIAGGYILTSYQGERFGIISAGPMPNPGYSIKLKSIRDGEKGPIITVFIQPPPPDSIQIQVISYPFIIGKIAQDTQQIKVIGLPSNSTVDYI